MQGVEVPVQPAGRDDEQPAGCAADAPERVRPVAGQEHERTRPRLELLAVAFDLQQAGEQVDALVLAVCVCRGGPPSTETVKAVSWPPVESALAFRLGRSGASP